METRKILSPNQKITFTILFFLLSIRFVNRDVLIWITHSSIPLWFDICYSIGVYLLNATVIWLNRDNLASLHVDKFFIIIFMLSGALLTLYLPIPLGIFTAVSTLLIFRTFQTGRFRFGETTLNYWQLGGLIALSLITQIPGYMVTFLTGHQIILNMNSVFLAVYRMGLDLTLFEELLFRGMLWMFLRHLNFSERKILYIQAFLFWVCHYNYFSSSPYTFWAMLPFLSLLYGIMVWKSKSLTPSSIAHVLTNFLTALLLQRS